MKKTILIVEDDTALQLAYKRALEQEFQIVVANDGKEAMSALQSHAVDLIVLDLVMPVQSGIEFLKELRTMPPYAHLPIIVATNLTQGEEKDVCLNLGVQGYCIKANSSLDEIVAKMRAALQK